MHKILISPYSRALRNGKENPKNFPYWKEVVALLKQENCYVLQIGRSQEKVIEGVDKFMENCNLKVLQTMILSEFSTWASVDNFLPHLCNLSKKPGVVVFSKSDPTIFGYKQNTNLVDKTKLRQNQFDIWESSEFNATDFVSPEVVASAILNLCHTNEVLT